MLRRWREDVFFIPDLREYGIFIWTGKYWKADTVRKNIRSMYFEVVDKIKKAVKLRASCDMCFNDVDEYNKLTRHLGNKGKSNAVIDLFLSDVAKDVKDLDQNQFYLNFDNGTLDLETGRLLEHDRKHLITRFIPREYKENAACQLWQEFIGECFDGCREMIDYVQRVYGYCLTGDMSEQTFWCCYGIGRNGKTVQENILLAAMGEYAVQSAPGTYVNKQNRGGNDEDLADVRGKRLSLCEETERGDELAIGLIKQITGGAPITTSKKYQSNVTWKPESKIILFTNSKPNIPGGGDYAFLRRIRLIPFTHVVPEKEVDPNLYNKLLKEIDGITAWMVHGCLAWKNKGMQPPNSVIKKSQEYFSAQNLVVTFVNDCCVREEGAVVDGRDLYKAYVKWCEDCGVKKVKSISSLYAAILESGLFPDVSYCQKKIAGINGKRFSGLRLRGNLEFDDDASSAVESEESTGGAL